MSEAVTPKKPRGRKPGQTNDPIPTITDPAISPYKIYVEENQFAVYDPTKNVSEMNKRGESIGFFSSLGTALRKISKLKVSPVEHTLNSYITEYETIAKNIIDSVSI